MKQVWYDSEKHNRWGKRRFLAEGLQQEETDGLHGDQLPIVQSKSKRKTTKSWVVLELFLFQGVKDTGTGSSWYCVYNDDSGNTVWGVRTYPCALRGWTTDISRAPFWKQLGIHLRASPHATAPCIWKQRWEATGLRVLLGSSESYRKGDKKAQIHFFMLSAIIGAGDWGSTPK